MKGKLIVLEGLDGSGKSTQAKNISSWLSRRIPEGGSVVTTREPGSIEGIRTILRTYAKPLDPLAECLLLFADRAQHCYEIINRSLEKGDWVVCDRYISSTVAYQGYARGLTPKFVQSLAKTFQEMGKIPKPDLEIYIDIPVDESLRRTQKRGLETDNFEKEGRPFLERIRDGYERFPPGWNRCTVDGCRSPDEVFRSCVDAVDEAFWGDFNPYRDG